ncbi:MAG: preprotein translocase subunit YajC [Oscillospiraceae bacterium]|nr:preprotein translocase subunit YajC [Oscillospiraceae bacterium]
MKTMKKLSKPLAIILVLALLLAPAVLAEDGAGESGEGGEQPSPGPLALMSTFIWLIPLVAVFYFMIIRPESKRKKAAAKLRSDLIVSDEVTTIGGIVGKVVQIKDDLVTIETSAERTRVTIVRGAISSREQKISD